MSDSANQRIEGYSKRADKKIFVPACKPLRNVTKAGTTSGPMKRWYI